MESQLDTEQDRRWKKKSGILKGRVMDFDNNLSPVEP